MTHTRGKVWLAAVLASCLAWPALAHDGKHAGSSIQGVVVSVSGDTIVIKAGAPTFP